jgi:hypothetical protein
MTKNSETKRKPEVIAGIFLLLTGFSVVITLLSDVEFLTSFLSLSEDIEYLNDNNFLLQINSLSWLSTAFFMTISAAALISAIVPHHSFLGYLQGLFLVLAAAMFCMAGIKGLTLNSLMKNYLELQLSDPDGLKTLVFILSKEKEIFLVTAYNLIGLSFFVIGIFAYLTLKIPIVTGILASATGILIPVFTLFIPDSFLADIGLIMACFMFFILTIRLLFRGLERKQKRKRIKKDIDQDEDTLRPS